MTQQHNAVFYTDGGCRTSKGVGGWGFHGYVYDDKAIKTGTGLKDWLITPLGYYSARYQLTGSKKHELWADWPELAEDPSIKNVNVVEYFDGCGALAFHGVTNNIAEMTAMHEALSLVLDKHETYAFRKVYVYTDSQYVKQGITEWYHNWQANDWIKSTGEPVSNREQWQVLIAAKETIESLGIELTIEWVRGHAGEHADFNEDDLGNAIADTLATKTSIIAEQGRTLVSSVNGSDAKGYWKLKVDANRLLAYGNWYFNTFNDAVIQKPDGRYIYHLGTHGKDDDFFCKRQADSSLCVVYLKHPEPILEAIRQQQVAEDTRQHNSIVIGRLDYIFKPVVYHGFLIDGVSTLKRRNHRLDLYTHDKIQLTRELQPPRLAFNLIEHTEVLETLLDQVIADEDMPQMCVTDVTDCFYDITVDKKQQSKTKIKPDINASTKSIAIDAEHKLKVGTSPCKITLTIGIDTPHRNALAGLDSKKPSIKVITWPESDLAFRYATVVQTEDDAGIYAGFYSNVRLIKNE